MLETTSLDALVVGAGFSGIYACFTLRKLGLEFLCIDSAGDVGGTWYHNTYPGAMSDTHSHLYRYSWDEEDFKAYPWTHNYLLQPEILHYLRHVVKRHELERYLSFRTELVSAVFNEQSCTWKVTVNTGRVFIVRYLITAMGLLSKPVYPDIPGLCDFRGTLVHSSKWDKDLDLTGKRVALIGSGSTGVQITTSVASQVDSLTCFIRHPQYVVPTGRREVTPEEREMYNKNFDAIWAQVRGSATAFGFEESKRSCLSATPQEREEVFEHLWNSGNGFYFMMGGFGDITTSAEANEVAASFVRRKIGQIVTDERKAKVLTPHDYYARRPLCANAYYEQFNRDTVQVVDLKTNPITSITGEGIITEDRVEHRFDVIIFATGFDALDGNYTGLHIAGRDGQTIKEHWSRTITSFGGVALNKFPNFFMILGPQSPFCNNPPAIEAQVELIRTLIQENEKTMRESDKQGSVEVTAEAELSYAADCEDAAAGSLFKKTSSWIFGANVPGKVYATRFYFEGLYSFRERVRKLIENSYQDFVFS